MFKKLYEAFLYIWYDGRSKMFYLGKHLGIPEDSYTHSSSIWESFTKDNIPERVHRRILAYGTDKEMCILENKCLENRKSKGKHYWKRYYNRGLGNPCYIDQNGENHHMYGRKHTEETLKKMSIIKIGKKHTEESKKKISIAKSGKNNHMYGKNHTEESKKKISISVSGENNPFHGKKHTEETKNKISIANSGENSYYFIDGRSKDKEFQKEYGVQYRAKNKQTISTQNKKWYMKSGKQICRKRYIKNKQTILAQSKKRYHRKVEIQYFINQGLVL